jgi:hypothetical protein
VYYNVIAAKVSGTWPPIVDICHVAFVAANRIVLNFAPDRAIIPYAAIVLDPITLVDHFSVLLPRIIAPCMSYMLYRYPLHAFSGKD